MGAAELIEVCVTLPVPGRYHYRVPPHLAGKAPVGSRVLVRFGKQKITGVVVRADTPAPEGVTPVDLSEVLDDQPALPAELVELCLWIADYYEAPPGEALRAALPAGSGVKSKQVFGLTAKGVGIAGGAGAALPAKQRVLLARLAEAELPLGAASAATRRVLEALITDGLVELRDHRASARVKLRRERVARLVGEIGAAKAASAKSLKKVRVLDVLAAGAALPVEMIEQQVPGAKVTLRELVKSGLVEITERELPLEGIETGADMLVIAPPVLTGEQTVAVGEITAALSAPPGADGRKPFTPFLLHGVTGSGKTEVYLRVIAEALGQGRSALVLVPEISLTPQLAARFRARFGDQVAILHSGLSEQARLGEWTRLARGEARIAVGARSAVFAPLTGIGVVVVDEEHDGSYKQDEGVRYHARDVAIVRAQRTGAVCVLGSGTPSLESAAHAEKGSYRLLRLTERPMARPMPTVEIIDLRTYMPDGEGMLTAPLRAAIEKTLAAGDQAILFLNRRGFATFVLCRACGHSFRCPNCSVSLTYHQHADRLRCHYCNRVEHVPEQCPKCKAIAIERKGLGTERVAAALVEAFPKARVARLDRDTASGSKVEVVLGRVARREVDILVGTQMVTKGHDFPGVTLVGVLCADTGLDLPDFRSAERTFQLLAQVAGRAGRGDRPGHVLIQTYRPTEPAVLAAAAHDYTQFFTAEYEARRELGYPPHGKLIAVRIDGADPHQVAGAAQQIGRAAQAAAEQLGGTVEVLGPAPAPLERLRGRTRWQILLRSSDRHALRKVARSLPLGDPNRDPRATLDVDPVSAL
ncbi:MAG: primosomal protein N' [Deltaproteobacteria bacterium]|nr:primosomal protein N' [Deltaproteobacteria bacterium]